MQNIFEVLDEVTQRLRDKTPYTIYDPARPDDEYDDYSRPFVAISSGGPVPASGDRGIIGTRYDGKILFWSISIYAPSPEEARYAKWRVFDALEGFVPENASELIAKGGMAYSRKSNKVRPALYVETLAFECRTNLVIKT